MCSPDGKWLVYASYDSGKFVPKKVSVDGGTPTQLSRCLADLRMRQRVA
jgi:Tol biopolymer transport system component